MFTISSIREKARQTLNETPGIYQLAGIPVLISVIVQLISFSRNSLVGLTTTELINPSYLFSSSLFPLFYGLLLGLLYLSVSFTVFHVIKGSKKTTSFRDVLTLFNHKDFGKIFSTFILKQFLLFLWGLLFYLGIAMVSGSSTLLAALVVASGVTDLTMLPQDVLAVILAVFLIGLIITLVGMILYIPQVYAYSQVDYILLEQLERGEYAGAFSIIKSSRKLMRGYKFKRFVLDITFLGWYILIGITFGLAGLYVWPYQYAAQVHFYKEIMEEQAKKLNI
ncbi:MULTISPECIES: DUF975 family protein [Streptococcus]|uniref:DUF975 family protein n=1 Tax=Streptococcus TaxID=1301 RepID=UPI0012DC8A3B|nr:MULTISPECIES: DUF975 family protein [Streptococcus]QHF54360.1 hypothetical protein BZG42_02860 [Streptococcus sp. DAT741]